MAASQLCRSGTREKHPHFACPFRRLEGGNSHVEAAVKANLSCIIDIRAYNPLRGSLRPRASSPKGIYMTGITVTAPMTMNSAIQGDSEEIKSLRKELNDLRSALESVQMENGSLHVELRRANKVIKVLSDRSTWFDRLILNAAIEDGGTAKFN